jgi:excisionase family DNA binding protein
MQNPTQCNDLMSPVEAAAYVHLSVNTLAKMRSAGTSMPFLKVGRKKVLYRRTDLDQWLTQCIVKAK